MILNKNLEKTRNKHSATEQKKQEKPLLKGEP
jgi:hypothetical protein